jgi:hypothetical protein
MQAGPRLYTLKVEFTIDGELVHERVATGIVFGDVWYVPAPPGEFEIPDVKPSGRIVRMLENQSKREGKDAPSRFSVCVSRTPKNRFACYWKDASGLAAALGHRIATRRERPVGVIFIQSKTGVPIKSLFRSVSGRQPAASSSSNAAPSAQFALQKTYLGLNPEIFIKASIALAVTVEPKKLDMVSAGKVSRQATRTKQTNVPVSPVRPAETTKCRLDSSIELANVRRRTELATMATKDIPDLAKLSGAVFSGCKGGVSGFRGDDASVFSAVGGVMWNRYEFQATIPVVMKMAANSRNVQIHRTASSFRSIAEPGISKATIFASRVTSKFQRLSLIEMAL